MSAPILSILVPFHGDDPSALMDALAAQMDGTCELVLFDDGSPDKAPVNVLQSHAEALDVAIRVVSSKSNLGRSGARNALCKAARGDWLLYLDADMEVPEGFLARWLELIRANTFDAAYGGYTLPAEEARTHPVHAALARAGDVISAEERAQRGASAFAGSNLAVRASLMAKVPFDQGYQGWGWEDVDWAVRASKTARLAHVDNPAGHGGLQSVDRLIAKFAEGGANHARFLARHPEQARLPGARLARLIAQLRLASAVTAITPAMARSSALPVRLRALALKAYKAACAARALGSGRSEATWLGEVRP
ncbi:MAG: glycosyltransferase [Oceanicaulis sp.]|uniref:glycosyltransferase family 2 protein n=1 Tax=Glycocaulis sp. TaxID=1969725 RepID=UPI0025C3F030|nr:glycosyltransferase [Glycocaulis sp.]MCC5980333.1 glycosyltransferase [Oceanicaulis sp.]MCH8521254.1 glycosyltransferase [Glycocaulis sp.]